MMMLMLLRRHELCVSNSEGKRELKIGEQNKL